ncbi:MAG: hypothetical protein UT60_C0005G0006 [candidate division CPR2 bacterium GW2011_GWD2_39_7]|nr:MAG: hypothetical protein UT60_C0005G0006 [candidate division CPR2 bacterium GW2011_GWD2_39_7]
MRKRFLFLLVVVILATVIVGCNGEGKQTKAKTTTVALVSIAPSYLGMNVDDAEKKAQADGFEVDFRAWDLSQAILLSPDARPGRVFYQSQDSGNKPNTRSLTLRVVGQSDDGGDSVENDGAPATTTTEDSNLGQLTPKLADKIIRLDTQLIPRYVTHEGVKISTGWEPYRFTSETRYEMYEALQHAGFIIIDKKVKEHRAHDVNGLDPTYVVSRTPLGEQYFYTERRPAFIDDNKYFSAELYTYEIVDVKRVENKGNGSDLFGPQIATFRVKYEKINQPLHDCLSDKDINPVQTDVYYLRYATLKYGRPDGWYIAAIGEKPY